MLKTLHIPYDRSHVVYARQNRKNATIGEKIMRNILKAKPC